MAFNQECYKPPPKIVILIDWVQTESGSVISDCTSTPAALLIFEGMLEEVQASQKQLAWTLLPFCFVFQYERPAPLQTFEIDQE